MYIQAMDSAQLITILFLILALMAVGIVILARQMSKKSSVGTDNPDELNRLAFDRDQLQSELDRTREEVKVLRHD